MPLFAPLYTVGAETADVAWATIEYDTDPSRVAGVLPRGLTPSPDGRVACWIARFDTTEFRSGGQIVERRAPFWQGGMCVRTAEGESGSAFAISAFIDGGLNAGIMGREVLGMPKKQVRRVQVHTHAGAAHAEIVNSEGEALLNFRADLQEKASSAPVFPTWMRTHRTIKAIPSADGKGWDVLKRVKSEWEYESICITGWGVGTMEWARSENDPLDYFPATGLGRIVLGRGRLSIGLGVNEADFLKH
ncbi:acetoacetate decarboxylase family protein [Leucobacter rhizosphaerae]|uniref:Acetoacetate decarboxylase family protein n=1 Tax=Leucobacter rhizosphaerae TaxID=2932245 RepID=A0ABY4FZ26_9MICO|nr:acetoacetate decarboxylase family protein [Leucobacter rhizosphaerae]UOQ61486.1 acetoacetate decarboxylase family protein [Leucobacter rhizosphaerae]